MFQIRFWYDREPDVQNNVKIICIRCIHCGKETVLYMNNINTNYKDIITSFVLNKLFHYICMSWINETHEQLKYDMVKHNTYGITGCTWYNTSIC